MAPSRGLQSLFPMASPSSKLFLHASRGSARRTFATPKPNRLPKAQPYKPHHGPSSSQSRQGPQDEIRTRRWRVPPLILVGVTGAAISLYITSVVLAYKRDIESVDSQSVPNDVSNVYDHTAEKFDDEVDNMEWVLGIRGLRKKLAEQAWGHVLEVSAGTGRNMEFLPLLAKADYTTQPYIENAYKQAQTRDGVIETEELRKNMRIQTVTLTDKSSNMVTIARLKWTKTHAWFANALFRIQDAALPVPFPSYAVADKISQRQHWGGFDTVIQTMGICSTPYPVVTLMNMGLLTSPQGQVLLLEHGQGHYSWLNDLLNKIAPSHAARHGCWFNKDIDAIIAESGLEVVEKKRYHFGTTYYYKLRAPSDRTELLKKYNEEMDQLGLETKRNKNLRKIAEVAEQVGGETGDWGSFLAGWWR